MFPEEFLHFIWQFQYFEKAALATTEGFPLHITHAGFLNSDAGPDFLEAKIRISDIEWNGQVEIHLRSSDWNTHKHQTDPAYDSVILHVVWEADKTVHRKDGTPIPQVELKDRVSLQLLSKYQDLIRQRIEVPCQTHKSNIASIKAQSMIDRVIVERLQRKIKEVDLMLQKFGGDWDATAVHLLVKYAGFKKNQEGFLQLSHKISYRVIQKIAFNQEDVEAYFMGLAGLLDDQATDEYAVALKQKYDYIKHKFELMASGLASPQWKFMRMRPANFPTVRLAQLSAILHKSPRLFSSLLGAGNVKQLKDILRAQVSPYWQKHYRFGEADEANNRELRQGMGDSSLEILIINTVVPLLFTYGRQQMNVELEEKAINLLRELSFESNSVTEKLIFIADGSSAYESQAFIELYKHYCMPRRCLSCQVGVDLVRQKI